MRANQSPLFRKIIAPWYDSEPACIAVIVFMVLVLCFGCLGLAAALNHPAHREHLWVPLVLILMGFYVLVSTTVRLFKRKSRRYSTFDEFAKNEFIKF